MKVRELIVHLSALPQEAIVSVTDSTCCGCGSGQVDSVVFDPKQGVFLDGSRPKREPRSTDTHLPLNLIGFGPK